MEAGGQCQAGIWSRLFLYPRSNPPGCSCGCFSTLAHHCWEYSFGFFCLANVCSTKWRGARVQHPSNCSLGSKMGRSSMPHFFLRSDCVHCWHYAGQRFMERDVSLQGWNKSLDTTIIKVSISGNSSFCCLWASFVAALPHYVFTATTRGTLYSLLAFFALRWVEAL